MRKHNITREVLESMPVEKLKELRNMLYTELSKNDISFEDREEINNLLDMVDSELQEKERPMYDLNGNRRPVDDLREDERGTQIENCKRQLKHLYRAQRGEVSTTLSKGDLEREIASYEEYLNQLTKKDREAEMVAFLESEQ